MEGILDPNRILEEIDKRIAEIDAEEKAKKDKGFQNELSNVVKDICGKGADDDSLGKEISEHIKPFYGIEDFHKSSLKYAYNNLYFMAIKTSEKGLGIFPNEKTLLSDLIGFYTHMREFAKAKKYVHRLEKGLEKNKWNEQCFMNIIYYYISSSLEENKSKIESLLSEYKKYFPEEDGLALSESDYQSALGDYSKAERILEERVAKPQKNAPRCALKLMQMQLKEGEFEKAKNTVDYFDVARRSTADYHEIAASNDLQPLLKNYTYTKCKIADAIMHLHKDDGDETKNQIELLKKQYKKLLDNPRFAMDYGDEIEAFLEELKFVV